MNKLVAMIMVLCVSALQAVDVTNNSSLPIKITIKGFNPRMGYSESFDVAPQGTVTWNTTQDICIRSIVIDHDGKINLRKELMTRKCNASKITLENTSGTNWTLKAE